jgi:peroxiredoxin
MSNVRICRVFGLEKDMPESAIITEMGKTKSKWVYFDPAYAMLVLAVVLAVVYAIRVSRQNSDLQKKGREYNENFNTLSGPHSTQLGDLVPAFKTVDLEGKVAEFVYNGTQKNLIFIFSPMCGVCAHEIPLWNHIAKLAVQNQITVCGLSIDSLEDTKKNAVGKDISFDLLIMPDMPTRRAYRVVSIPEVLIVSSQGSVEWVHYGALTQDKLNDLQSKLKESDRPKESR